MSGQSYQTSNPEVSSDDKLWVILCFLIPLVLPVITLFLADKKDRPFIKYHTIPTLLLGLAEWIVAAILAMIPFVGCAAPLLYIINVYYALQANKGAPVDIPFITNFAKAQNWM